MMTDWTGCDVFACDCENMYGRVVADFDEMVNVKWASGRVFQCAKTDVKRITRKEISARESIS